MQSHFCNPKNASRARTSQVSKKWVCTRTLQLATAHCNSQLAIVHRKSRISLSQVMNCTSLLMNNSLVHEENRNKTQVLELIPYFHFFSSSNGGAVQWRNFDDRLFECQLFHYLFNQERLRNTFITTMSYCIFMAYFRKIKFQQFLWQHKESALN